MSKVNLSNNAAELPGDAVGVIDFDIPTPQPGGSVPAVASIQCPMAVYANSEYIGISRGPCDAVCTEGGWSLVERKR